MRYRLVLLELKEFLNHHLVLKIVKTFSIRGVALIIGLATNIILAKQLEPAGFGLYALVLSIVAVVTMPFDSGFGTLLVRQVAIHNMKQEWGLLKGLVRFSSMSILTVLLVEVLLMLIYALVSPESNNEIVIWWVAAVLVPLMSLSSLRGNILRGLSHPVLGQVPDQIVKPLLFLTIIFFITSMFHKSLTPVSALIANTIATMVAFIVGTILLFRLFPKEVANATELYEKKKWLASVAPLTLLSGIQVLNNSTAVFLLGILKSSDEIGLYKAAEQFSAVLLFSLIAVDIVMAPQLAKYMSAGENIRAQRLSILSARVMFFVSAPLAIGYLLFGKEILIYFYGQSYGGASNILAFLTLGVLVNLASGPNGALMNMSGNERQSLRVLAETVIVNVFLSVALISLYSATGAAMASMSSMAYLNIRLNSINKRVNDISGTIFGKLHERLK